MKNSDKQILESFAVGEYIRMMKTKDGIYKCFNYNKENNISNRLTKTNLIAYYFMKDKDSISINGNFSPSFIKSISSEIKSLNSKSEVYYNTDNIKIDSSTSFLQYNDRCYFLNKNKYDVEKPYSIKTFKLNKNMYDKLSSYVSEKYDKSYFSLAQNVDNKSIPIYDVTGDALKRISYLKFSNKSNIIPFLKKYNLEECKNILFNSDELKLNNENYDSIYIENLLNEIAANPDNLNADEIFDDLFSNLEKESFLRMFNKIGQLDSIRNEKNSVKENQYMYSFDLSIGDNEKNIPMNYFTLKNLKSPELYQDYFLTKTNFKSVKSNAYDLTGNIISNIFIDFYKIVVNEVHQYLIDNDCLINLNKIVKTDGFLNEIIELLHKKYPNFDKNVFQLRFSKISDNYLKDGYFEIAYRDYFKTKYNLDIRFDTVVVSKLDLIKKILDLYIAFNEKFNLYILSDRLTSLNKMFEDSIKYLITKNIYDFSFSDETSLKEFYKTFNEKYENYEEDKEFKHLKSEYFKSSVLNEIENDLFKCKIDNNKTVLNKAIEEGIFKIDIYKNIIKPILIEMGKIDQSLIENASKTDILDYNIRLNSKISDYMSSYDNFFDHENQMMISGHLYGFRKYNEAFKNTNNDMYLTYNYDTSFDVNFMKETLPNSKIYRINKMDDFNDLNIMPSSIIFSDDFYILNNETAYGVLTSIFGSEIYTSETEENKLNAGFMPNAFLLGNSINLYEFIYVSGFNWIRSEYGDLKLFKITDNECTIALKNSNIDSYFNMLNKIKDIEFSERIKGEHYYKEIKKSKSNVFSLNIRNSGLSYNLYSFDEVVQNFINNDNVTLNEDGTFKINGENHTFSWMLDHSNYHKIIEDEKTFFSEVKDNEENDNFKLFKYFKCSDDKIDFVRKTIKSKIQIRKTFNDSIRKSIHRYMPVNTTLWKINYLKDDVIDII